MVKNDKSQQVSDDPRILKLMMNDVKNSPNLYLPTHFWSSYERVFLPELEKYGLEDFRRRKNSVLSSFGATDLLPMSRSSFTPVISKSHGFRKLLIDFIATAYQSKKVQHLCDFISSLHTGVRLNDVQRLYFEFAEKYGEIHKAKPLREFDASMAGNPEDFFKIDGKMYTTHMLYYYIQYAYCSQFVNFDEIHSIMELGCGSGKQVELIKKLHPDINFFLFDIPPQLYVCEQYLSKVFPDSVISYKDTRVFNEIDMPEKGKIYIFGNWKLPHLNNFKYDLFWNSASFQEMEPDIVANYLKFINHQTINYVFLHEMMAGQRIAQFDKHGVLKPTTIDDYKKGLTNFKLMDLSSSIFFPIRPNPYSLSFWNRKK